MTDKNHDPDHTSHRSETARGIAALVDKSDESEESPEKRAEDPKKDAVKKRDATANSAHNDAKDNHGKSEKPPAHKKPLIIAIVSAVVLVIIIAGIAWWLHARHYVSTDDAYIDGHITRISPQIPALVLKLHITDNQFVQKGDLLIELDPTDYQVALEQAKAQAFAAQGRLAQSQAQIEAAKAAVNQANAEIQASQASLENANSDLKRLQQIDERARSRQQLDNAIAAQKNSQAQLDEAKAKKVSADVNITTSEAAVKAAEGEFRMAQANVKRAEVNLSYCQIRAPCPGRVTQRTVEAGAYVQTGQAMFALVDPEVWVTANFKETQLKNMRPGQPVTIKVDAFSGTKFQGHIDSIQAGSGSRFSVLPAENATGNFVKVVQRVPVKILFNHDVNTDTARLLSPGLSVIPKVKVL